MQNWSRLLVFVFLGLAGCSTSEPVAVLRSNGQVLVGSATAGLTAGTIQASNALLACNGHYNQWNLDPTVNFTIHCSDGREGFGTAFRNASMRGGRGSLQMNNGEVCKFIYGSEASDITAIP